MLTFAVKDCFLERDSAKYASIVCSLCCPTDAVFTQTNPNIQGISLAFEQEVNGTVISIYCFPIVNSKGEHIGAFAFDLSLEQSTENIENVKPYPNSYITQGTGAYL